MYENRLLCKWVAWRFKRSIAYRIAVQHAQRDWVAKQPLKENKDE